MLVFKANPALSPTLYHVGRCGICNKLGGHQYNIWIKVSHIDIMS